MQAILLVTVFSCLLAAVDAGDKALGGDCIFASGGQSDCADANAICTPQGTPKCVCKPGYEKAGTACIEAVDVALGGDCTFANGGQSNCADATAICTPQATPKCDCKSGYEKSGTACIAEHTIGASCTSSDGSKGDCSDVNAICPASSKCECKTGYTGTPGGTCAVNNKGSAPGHLSMWMLCTTFMTMSLAVHVV